MRIGILGGSFNPVHNAHLQMAVCARDALTLDRVLLMVAADPPHKAREGMAEAAERFRMAKLACRGFERIEASARELARPGKSYMADTLRELKECEPSAELYLIVGSDMLRDIPLWHTPERVAALAAVAYVPRIGQEAGDQQAAELLRDSFGARVTALPGCADDISSTRVRERLYAGLPVEDLLPPPVLWHCYTTGLYFPEPLPAIIARLRTALGEKRFLHSAGTAMLAARLSEAWGADPQKARLAAYLHDCAKKLDEREMRELSDDETGIAAVQHAFAGAALARRAYGVQDEEVLGAIYRHCTGEAGMGLLDKIIYLADIAEPTRAYPGVEDVRKSLLDGPDAAMLFALTRSKAIIRKKNKAGGMHPATLRAIAYYQQILYK